MITAQDANRMRNSATCPGCDGQKMTGNALCRRCLEMLPEHMRTALLFSRPEKFTERYGEAIRCVRQRRVTATQMRAGRHTSS